MTSPSSWAWISTATLTATIASTPVAEARETRPRFDIPAAPIAAAIAEAAREAQVSIGTEGGLPHISTPRVRGRMSVGKALARLLAHSGYSARQVGPTAWRIERARIRWQEAPNPLPQSAEEDSEPIVVTGTKRPILLDALPMSVGVVAFDSAEDSATGVATATVAERSEGLAMTALGPGRNRLFIHGVADSAFNGESQSTVAVVLNDSRLTYAAPDPDIRLVDVQRVEVLKGPQGSLYGAGTLGGIYHIVTSPPDTSAASLHIQSGADLIAGSLGWNGTVIANLPIVRNEIAVRLVGYAAGEPGWVETGGRLDTNSTRLTGGRAALAVMPGGGWRFDVTGLAQFLSSRDSSYVYRADARFRPDQLPEPHDNDLGHVALRAEHSGGLVDVVLSSGATWHDVNDTLDATIGAASFGIADPTLMSDDHHFEVYDNELRATGRAFGRITWVGGLAYLLATQHHRQSLEGAPGETLVVNDEQRSSEDAALFADATIPLTGRLSLEVGGRVSSNTEEESRSIPSSMVEQHSSRTAFTPSGALSWRPREGRLIYLRYGSAFRQGGIDVSPSGVLRKLLGDELATVEAGWKEKLPAGGRLEITSWYSWWENVQSDVLGPDALIDTVNAGNATIFGIEGSWTQSLRRGLNLELGGNWTNASLTRNALGIRLDDLRLPVVPEYAVRGQLEYKLRIGSRRVRLRASVRYDGPARLSFDPAIDRPMGDVLDVGLRATTTVRGWSLSAQVDNLLDSAHDTFAYGNPFRLSSSLEYTPQPPRTVRLSITRRFP